MKLTKGFFLVVGGHILKLTAGMVIFIILARFLGPKDFGEFSYWMAIATLLSLPVNFGFGSMVLRSFGIQGERAAQTMENVLAAKITLTVLVVLVVLLTTILINSSENKWLFLILVGAQICESFSEFYVLGFRINSHFKREALVASFVSGLHIFIMLGAILVSIDILFIAATFAFSRFLGLGLTRYYCQLLTGPIKVGTILHVGTTLKKAWAYAVELGLLTTYGQIDTIIINYLCGPAIVGLYQAGMKLVQGASRLAPLLAQVVLPKLSKSAQNNSDFKRLGKRIVIIFIMIGAVGGVFVGTFARVLTEKLYGYAYVDLVPLLPLFGLLLFARYIETGMGLLLVATGLQEKKVWFVALQLVLVATAGSAALNTHGLAGWQLTNVVSISLLVFVYGWLLNRRLTVSKHG